MLYDVHLYVTCRVKVWNVEAESHKAAIDKAYDEFSGTAHRDMPQLDDVISERRPQRADDSYPVECQWGGYSEEVICALVDEFGDDEFERSKHYDFPQCGTWQEMVASLREAVGIVECTHGRPQLVAKIKDLLARATALEESAS